jgi:hypothetical protein
MDPSGSMLAERISLVLPVFHTGNELSFSLLHQVASHLLRLLLSQRGVHIWRQFAKHSSSLNHVSPPLPLLWRDVGRGRDFDLWVHKEQRQQFTMSGSGCVVEFERKNAMLKYVWEDEQTAFARRNFTQYLESRQLFVRR